MIVLSFVQILDEMPVFYNLNATEKREVLIVILQIVRNLDDTSLVKAWQQSIARTRLFFKLMEECLVLFEVVILSEIQYSFDILFGFLLRRLIVLVGNV